MVETITIGDKTTLHGFEVLERDELLISKKQLGSYIRAICDNFENCSINIYLEKKGNEEYLIKSELLVNDKTMESETSNNNLFMALDESMKGLIKEAGVSLEATSRKQS